MDAKSPVNEDDRVPTAPRSRVSGIDRAVQILDHLFETGTPSGPYAIAKAIGLPVSTAYAIIDDLIKKDLLNRRNDGAIWLGPRLHHYGLAYARSLDFLNEATHEMHALCREVNETVQICDRDGDSMVVLAMADGPGHFRVTSRVGTRVPLNWTASGRLLVGHLPDEERLAIFSRCARPSPTGRAETNPAALAEASRRTLLEGLSIQTGTSEFWIACIAAPIFDTSGACVASISIVLPEQRFAQDPALFTTAVRGAAKRIWKTLGTGDHGFAT